MTASLRPLGILGATLLPVMALAAAAPKATVRIQDRVPAKVPDALLLADPAEVKLTGYLGRRVANSEANRLVKVDEAPLLAGFRKRPGEQAWIGEHVGKWLHASTLAWVNTGDPALRTKLDRMVVELLKTQEPDGYLGTYTPDKRFGLYENADWDVWVHKYNLIGLLTYYRYTGNASALTASRKMGDLLLSTFGPGKKSILSAGTHVGMASTSVLEPMVLLYRTTGDARYLEFCRYLVKAWDEPKGPAVLTTLLTKQAVNETANGKAYEMLSNLVGLCELYRVTGEQPYLQAAQIAWEDVVSHQLYLTGTASHHEHFHAPHDLPNGPSANLGETCVTVTWMQLNTQLLRLTGESKYGDELERSAYNHLAGAQRPDGAQWCYYTPLQGAKPYGPGINCCVSSGPRGMALLPQLTFLKAAKGNTLLVNLLENGTFKTQVGGQSLTLTQTTAFPSEAESVLSVSSEKPVKLGLRVRVPQWAVPLRADLPGSKPLIATGPGWLNLPERTWKKGDQVRLRFVLRSEPVEGEYGNSGRTALRYGPLVMAYDEARNPGLPAAAAVALLPTELKAVPGNSLALSAEVQGPREATPRKAVLVPFAEAGANGSRFQVWLRNPGTGAANASLFAFADESRTRDGNVNGSITDGDPDSFVVTFNAMPAAEDAYTVSGKEKVTFQRVVFCHGKNFHDGGWFDASAGKPKLQVQRTLGGPWETVATLDLYPATTATSSRGLRDGQAITVKLPTPVEAVALRVVGKPASGDNPAQAFSSCAELQAFPK